MKLVLPALLLALAAQNAAFAESEKPPTLAVMSWNVRYNNPGDGENAWPKRKDWVGEIIRKQDVDVAGFQEVRADQFGDLKERLPEMDVYGVGRDDGKRGGEFCPIFYRKSRFECLDKSTFWLSETPDKAGSVGWDAAITRIASWVKLKEKESGEVFYFINTHFDHRGEKARTQSAALLVERLRKQFHDHPVVLSGDLNAVPTSAPYKAVVDTGGEGERCFLDAYLHAAKQPTGANSTWNGFRAIVPDIRIDYVLVTESLKVLEAEILVETRAGRFPSDHFPVTAKLEFAGE